MSDYLRGKKSNSRRYPGVKGPRPDHKKLHQDEAIERKAYTDTLTPQQRIEVLDRRLGKDQGAVKERARLALKLAGTKAE